MRMHEQSSRRAFTIVEMLAVIGVIAVLLGILLPMLPRRRSRGDRWMN